MTNIELVLNMLAEVTTTTMSKEKKLNTMAGHKKSAKEGGKVAKTETKVFKLSKATSELSLESIDGRITILEIQT